MNAAHARAELGFKGSKPKFSFLLCCSIPVVLISCRGLSFFHPAVQRVSGGPRRVPAPVPAAPAPAARRPGLSCSSRSNREGEGRGRTGRQGQARELRPPTHALQETDGDVSGSNEAKVSVGLFGGSLEVAINIMAMLILTVVSY